ncbi:MULTISPECIES: type III secretion system needle filament subunit SctF [unclassified Symbiopectobacterium]|uniref:type III secretion system needle filament subunit SctF n=1 Tax=unclassified Symbiopectobacterium TaxID=2794573 RepID=UPI002226D983|nr:MULTISPECIES: type III secretion system needle filament subunit SctF [unclassified Symbiopectobacterium]MCW2474869.1 type III secretion system needle filament subunit SctF [Candidatus Symbiopectobacterium sp. NZEC151]MCW2482354.1 type III secretion system needle filament subunit SctF [Candidatus Symbiopectobacterium sp. NZEC135]MCW2487403.1 type III secretion system needle filament subunit SctF [Candidatus Symbiopectobacterium sp. NZEC127]
MADTKYTPQHVDTIFLDKMSGEFEAGAKTLMEHLNTAKTALTADPSNPSVLADYQSKLQAYTLFRNAQTSTIKAYKDIGAAIIQNFR